LKSNRNEKEVSGSFWSAKKPLYNRGGKIHGSFEINRDRGFGQEDRMGQNYRMTR
jgi:hypothetical protein